MKRVMYVLTAIVLILSNVSAFGEEILDQAEPHQLIEDMIMYYGCYGDAATEEIDGLLEALKKPTPVRENSGKRSWITGDMSIQTW